MKVLIPIDRSSGSRQVIPFAATLAKAAGASMTLLTVCDPSAPEDLRVPDVRAGVIGVPGMGHAAPGPSTEPGGTSRERREQAIAATEDEAYDYLRLLASQVEASGVSVNSVVVVDTDVVGAITRLVQRDDFDLIAMSTHGRSGLDEAVNGSVARDVLRSGVAPVLMLRPHQFVSEEEPPSGEIQLGSNYLVVAHVTASSPELLDSLRRITRNDPEARFVLLVPPSPLSSWPNLATDMQPPSAGEVASQAEAKLRESGINIVRSVIGEGSAVDSIEKELASASEFQGIVVSTLPIGLSRWLRFDVPHQIERRFHLPVTHVVATSASR